MPLRASSYGYWSGTLSFVLASAGVAIGLGNLWRLPALAVEHGGSAFLVLYVVFLLVVGMPLLLAEWTLGRWMRSNIVWGFRHLAQTAKAHRAWVVLGWMALASAAMVLSYFCVVAGWSLGYLIRAAGGGLGDLVPATANATFVGLAADAERSLAWHTIFVVAITILASHGVRNGLEGTARVAVPAVVALLAGLVAFGALRGGAGAGVAAMLEFRPGDLGTDAVLAALSQAFFTLSVGMGVMLAYGGYLKSGVGLAPAALGVIGLDLAVSIAGGVAIYALVQGGGVQAGALLLFEQLPLALAGPGHSVVAVLALYLLVVLIALTTAVGLMEPMCLRLMERFGMSRVFAATSVGLIIWFLGLASLLSFNLLQDLAPGGRTVAEWILSLAGQLLMPLMALGLCVFVSRVAPRSLMREAWGGGNDSLFAAWLWCLRYPVRVGLIVLLIDSTGLIDTILAFWGDD